MKTTVQIEVDVPQDWIEFCTKYSDLFGYSYCGYWAYGVERDQDRGWLLYAGERATDCGDGCGAAPPKEAAIHAVLALWRSGAPLPRGYYRLNVAAAVKAYGEGCKLWGVDWYEKKGDANTYDVVVQLALLGEVVYG
jgi:hypothetical protein